MKRYIIAAAIALVAAFSIATSTPAMADSSSTIAPSVTTSCAPYVSVLFTWYRTDRDPRHLGYDFTKITHNRCNTPERVFITCEYVGPHAAHYWTRFYGNTVRAIGAISGRDYCHAHVFNLQWSLITDTGGGFGIYYSGSWHYKQLVPGGN